MTFLLTKLCSPFFKLILSLILWILFGCAFVPIFSILIIFRFLASKLVPFLYDDVSKILVTTSANFVEAADTTAPVAVFSFVFEGVIELEDVRSTFESRVIQKKNEFDNLQWPEFQQFIFHKFGHPFWKWDKSFNIQKHINMLQVEKSGLNPQEILDIIEDSVIPTPFPVQQSPWEILIVHNFNDTPELGNAVAEGSIGTMILFKVHHALGDGRAISKVFEELFDGPNKGNNELNSKSQGWWYSSLWNSLKFYVLFPYEIASLTVLLSSAKVCWKLKPKVGRFNFAVSPTIPAQKIKTIRKANNVSFSAIVLAATGNALNRFMKEAGYEVPKTLCSGVMRGVDGHPLTKMRNYLTVAVTEVPIGQNIGQLGLIEASLNKVTGSRGPQVLYVLSQLGGAIAVKHKRHEDKEPIGFSLTNLKLHAHEQRWRGTNKLRSIFCCGKGPAGSDGILLLSVGYKEEVRFLFQIDEGIVSKNQLHAQVFIKYFLVELEAMADPILQNCNLI